MARISKSIGTSGINPAAGLGKRILRSRLEASISGPQKISQVRLGLLVARYLGSMSATGATVSRWEAGESLPDLATVGGIAAVCHVDPGWLAFGDFSKAPAPWAVSHELIERAGKQDQERLARLVARLRVLPQDETPEIRQESRDIIAEMDAPGAMDRIARIRMTDEEEEAADRMERERLREQRMDWLQQDLDDGLITMDEFNQAYESEED